MSHEQGVEQNSEHVAEQATTPLGHLRNFVASVPQSAQVKWVLRAFDRSPEAPIVEDAPAYEADASHRVGRLPGRIRTDATGTYVSVDIRALRALLVELRAQPENRERDAEIAAVFADIHPLDGERLAEAFPQDVANLAGVPASVRMTAHRALIARRHDLAIDAVRTAQRRLHAAKVEFEFGMRPTPRFGNPLTPYQRAVDRAEAELAQIEQFETQFVDHNGVAHDRQFLTVVPSSRFSSGRVVEVFGDLGRASHVLVVVPGVGNSYTDFRETRLKSESMYRTAATEHPQANVAVIEWMGYEVPGWLRSPLPFPAINGGAELKRFMESLSLRPSVELTVLGHSYGSVVVSEALRNGLKTDRVIFTGSPGVRAPVAAALGIDPSKVFALSAARDVVTKLRWHGKNPADAPFGATRLAADGNGHRAYFIPESISMRNIARVVLGNIDALVHAVRNDLPEAAASAPPDAPPLVFGR